jgi:hypothetical protein
MARRSGAEQLPSQARDASEDGDTLMSVLEPMGGFEPPTY